MAIDTGGQHDELTQSRATVCIKLADINKNNQAIESRDMKGGSAILISAESRNKEKLGFKKPPCSLHDSVQC